jgi:hypothetical protein
MYRLTLAALVVWATSGVAQARPGRVEARAGIAAAIASTFVGGQQQSDVGPLFTGQLGLVLSRRSEFTLDLALQPFKAKNPVRSEAYTAAYALLGLQLGLGESRRGYLRPEVGLARRSWSGADVWVSSDTGPVFGVAVGYESDVAARLGLASELFLRISGADELGTALFGLSLSIVPVGARPRAP